MIQRQRFFAFSPALRLHFHWEYRRFFNQSQIFRLSECAIYRIRNDRGHPRLGITIKARGSSVERNHVKRRIRETFRRLSAVLGSYDYNVVIPATKKMAYPYPQKLAQALQKELEDALKRA